MSQRRSSFGHTKTFGITTLKKSKHMSKEYGDKTDHFDNAEESVACSSKDCAGKCSNKPKIRRSLDGKVSRKPFEELHGKLNKALTNVKRSGDKLFKSLSLDEGNEKSLFERHKKSGKNQTPPIELKHVHSNEIFNFIMQNNKIPSEPTYNENSMFSSVCLAESNTSNEIDETIYDLNNMQNEILNNMQDENNSNENVDMYLNKNSDFEGDTPDSSATIVPSSIGSYSPNHKYDLVDGVSPSSIPDPCLQKMSVDDDRTKAYDIVDSIINGKSELEIRRSRYSQAHLYSTRNSVGSTTCTGDTSYMSADSDGIYLELENDSPFSAEHSIDERFNLSTLVTSPCDDNLDFISSPHDASNCANSREYIVTTDTNEQFKAGQASNYEYNNTTYNCKNCVPPNEDSIQPHVKCGCIPSFIQRYASEDGIQPHVKYAKSFDKSYDEPPNYGGPGMLNKDLHVCLGGERFVEIFQLGMHAFDFLVLIISNCINLLCNFLKKVLWK